ncbi:YybH family protein [Scytonema millei]|uniref:Nuclear transport factor 2 family protein n=1 Tax=Scytonema millei VB511283 TaxID=1245923 RepID=A0A9X5E6L8_9CYAN|nr:ketosteroid isomerase family protein [Scytonema millei]NHC36265.1 nuclear transport factor 2 family protein [Scytonema millei VB511283]
MNRMEASTRSQQDTVQQITGITESTIVRYFDTLNTENYQACANLFATDGVMYPPFEAGILGREAIASFLQGEAQGMKLEPERGISQVVENGDLEVQVVGKVQTPVFGVNVSWFFLLNSQQEIAATKIKLLGSPQELLSLKR